jgi:hypothetical protein
MNDDQPDDGFLWDRTGVEDPQVVRLERALQPYRLAARAPRSAPRPRRPRLRIVALAAAASVLAALPFVFRRDGTGPAYRVETLEGSAQVEGGAANGVLRAGDALVTDGRSRVRLEVEGAGDVVLEPGTRLRVERPERGAQGAEHLLYLERGTVVASIFAAPRAFQVGTPAGIAVDLGCIYRTTVEQDGATRLAVVSGQVSFEAEGRRAIVPSGAWCRARPGVGPGPAFREDASAAWVAAVERVEQDPDPPREALDPVLEGARGEEDALTLWHLLEHPSGEVRAAVLDALAELNPPPRDVDRAALLGGDRAALDRWRQAMPWSW